MNFLNELEMSPFSHKGQIAIRLAIELIKQNGVENVSDIEAELLNEFSFLNKFYVDPLTRFCSNESNVKIEDEINYQRSKEILIQKFESFEKNLNSNVANLFWLYGPAGCGKTTYLYDLKRRFINCNISINDFEDVEHKVVLEFEGKEYEIGKQKLWNKHNCYRFCLLVIEGIFKTLKLEESLVTKNYDFLRKIIDYSVKLGKQLFFSDESKKFFILLKNLIVETNQDNLTKFVNFFKNIVDVETEYINFEDNICYPIQSLINIAFYLLVCIGNVNEKREIFIFDNIEYYIRALVDQVGQRIPDKTIEIIIQSVIGSLEYILGEMLNHNIKYVPCYIIVTRPATATFNLNGQVNSQYSIDITKWFWAKEIYEKRINYLKGFISRKDQNLYDLFLNILSDCTNSSWSLGIFLPRLFNFDYRRLCRVTLSSLKVGFLYSSNKFEKNYNRFLKIWEHAQQLTDKNNNGIRHLCRIYIIRMVLDEFNKINQFELGKDGSLFEYLKFDCNQTFIPKLSTGAIDRIINRRQHYENNEYSSYVRKVLTILHRFEIELSEEQVGILHYMSFETFLKEMFLCGGRSNANIINSDWLKNLSSILYYMNEYSDKANWGQLTTIKWNYDAQNYSSNELFNILCQARNNIISGKGYEDLRFGIKINPAGQVFLKLLPEFEFFDLRYCEDLPSLFTDDAMKKENCWKAEQIIDRVLYNSLFCCNEVIVRDYSFFASLGKQEVDFSLLYSSKLIYHETLANYSNLTHPQRIINQQLSYLNEYKNFVTQLEPNEDRFKNINEKLEFLMMLDEKIRLYQYAERKYKEKYPKYFAKRRG